MKKLKACDFTLMISVFGILVIGLIMVFSSSWPDAIGNPVYNGDGTYFFKRQMVFFGVGLVGMFVAMNIDYKIWKKWSKVIFLGALVIGTLVLIPSIGVELNGARRWVKLPGGTLFMPSDVMKLGSVIFLAAFLSKSKRKIKRFKDGFLAAMFLIALPCGIILVFQKDLGTSGALGITLFVMLFVGGAKINYLAATGAIGLLVGGVFMRSHEYRWKRFTTFLDPFEEKLGAGWQVVQSLYAIGSGGLLGAGLGQSKQKYYYIPEPYSDFIFSIFAEEFGFLGVVILVGLYLTVAWRGFKIALSVKDCYGSYLALGITSLIVIQTFIHMAVASSSMPATGITMPFVSYGGTSLMIYMFAMGILLNISRHAKIDGS